MTTVDADMTALVRLADLLGTPAPALRLVLSLVLGFPLALAYRHLFYGKSPTLQHLYFILSGLALGYWNYEENSIHFVAAIFTTYLIIKIFGGTSLSVIISFVFNMMYLLYGYYTTSTANYDIKWTLPHCVLTLRLIGLTFDVWDSKKPIEELSISQKQILLTQQPSLLEIFSYALFPGSFLVGPQFSMRRFLDFTNGDLLNDVTRNKSELPHCFVPGLKRACLGLLYVALYQLSSFIFTSEYILSDEFQKTYFIWRMVYVTLWVHFILYKYMSCWLIAEGICIAFGLTYNGKSSTGEHLWNGCANVDVKTFETAACLTDYILAFNINTNHWSAEYIYKRLKFLNSKTLSNLFTLMFLAIWHGFHTGYYWCFAMEFLIVYFEKDMGPILAKHVKLQQLINKNVFTKLCTTMIRMFYATFFMSYGLTPFVLLKYDKYVIVYRSLYFCGHVTFISYPFVAPFLKKVLRMTDEVKRD